VIGKEDTMTLTRKDAAATLFATLSVLAFAATHEGWNVWLIGDNHRWAAALILVLGLGACITGGQPDAMTEHKTTAMFGGVALVLGVLAIVTGSLTPLSLLVACIVVLWMLTTVRHALAHHVPGQHSAA
jgi:hypothetical protein